MPGTENDNQLNLRSEEVQEILSTPPAWIINYGNTLVLVITLLVLILSFLIKYPDVISAKVIVTTKRPTEKVVARYSGALEQVFIENGDTVTAGQQLAIFRNTAKTEDVHLLQSLLDSMVSGTADWEFPFEKLTTLNLGDIEPAYITFEKSFTDYSLLRDLDPYRYQLSSNSESIKEIKLQLRSQLEQRDVLREEYELEQKDFNRYTQLFERGVISEQEFEAKKQELLQVEKSFNSLTISLSQLREAISSAEQNLNTTRINQFEDDTRLSAGIIQSLNALRRAINEWEETYVLSASINGRVGFQEVWGVNQYVGAGEVVFAILPLETDSLVGKLVLPSQNAGKVIVNQKVLVKLDNFPYQQYGSLIGKVENISVSPDKEGNYIVYISLPEGTTTSYKKELPFEQELLGNADIITENLSVAQRIFYRFKNLLEY